MNSGAQINEKNKLDQDISWVEAEMLPQFTSEKEILKYVTVLNSGLQRKHRLYWLSKRIFDFAFATVLILLTLPLLVVIALAIKIDSKGPILFLQPRIGHRLKIFSIFKFRTMHDNIDRSAIAMVLDGTVQRRPGLAIDPRLTRLGRFLRRFSLDELPQIFNILMGDMTFVGPRPLTVLESTNIPDWAIRRYSVPVGITGLSQITNRNVILTSNRFEPDLVYVDTCSWLVDLKILWKTLFVLISD